MKIVTWIAMILLVVGGLNWLLVGAFGFDLVATLFGECLPSHVPFTCSLVYPLHLVLLFEADRIYASRPVIRGSPLIEESPEEHCGFASNFVNDSGTAASPELLARLIFSQQAPWNHRPVKIRDVFLVAPFHRLVVQSSAHRAPAPPDRLAAGFRNMKQLALSSDQGGAW